MLEVEAAGGLFFLRSMQTQYAPDDDADVVGGAEAFNIALDDWYASEPISSLTSYCNCT